jgi:hypothetical protein
MSYYASKLGDGYAISVWIGKRTTLFIKVCDGFRFDFHVRTKCER